MNKRRKVLTFLKTQEKKGMSTGTSQKKLDGEKKTRTHPIEIDKKFF